MMRIEREPIPECLREMGQTWSEEYQRTRKWKWKHYQGTPVNQLLLQSLRRMTNNHCSFCDSYPLNTSGETIEHFKPKHREPLLAYEWSNLFYCCYHCQKKKGRKFEEELLKPDEETYAFESYFIYNSITGEIEPNPACSSADKKRARATIRLYGLNDFDRPESRKEFFEKFNDAQNPDIGTFPYRFIY